MSEQGYVSTWPYVKGLRIHTHSSITLPRSKRSVVLIHGLGVSADYMLPTFVKLAPDFQVWAPELPGFGASDKPSHILDIGELADVLAEWVSIVGISSAVFLGNSLGCQVIVDLATRYPALVQAMILVGPTVDSNAHTMIQQLWRGLRDVIREPWSLWRILARDYLRTGTRRMYRTFRFALQDHISTKCRSIDVPTLIVRGSLDTIAPRRWIAELAEAFPNGSAAEVGEGTHAANYTAPEKLAAIVTAFIDRLSEPLAEGP